MRQTRSDPYHFLTSNLSSLVGDSESVAHDDNQVNVQDMKETMKEDMKIAMKMEGTHVQATPQSMGHQKCEVLQWETKINTGTNTSMDRTVDAEQD